MHGTRRLFCKLSGEYLILCGHWTLHGLYATALAQFQSVTLLLKYLTVYCYRCLPCNNTNLVNVNITVKGITLSVANKLELYILALTAEQTWYVVGLGMCWFAGQTSPPVCRVCQKSRPLWLLVLITRQRFNFRFRNFLNVNVEHTFAKFYLDAANNEKEVLN